jgi:hypothetical protein
VAAIAHWWNGAPACIFRGEVAWGSFGMAVKVPDLDQWVDAMAPILGLTIAAETRAGVKANLKTAAKMAALLDKAGVKGETDPAPVFRV